MEDYNYYYGNYYQDYDYGDYYQDYDNYYQNYETLYEKTKKNEDLILLPKNKNKKYTTVLIWLTGLEEPPEEFESMFNYSPSLLPHPERTKVIILCGEKKHLTAFEGDPYGSECFSWFDVYSFEDISMNSINFEDVKNSSKRIINIIEEEAKYLGGYENIFLGGFSQGACMSLHIGCSFNHLLGGVICCGGALFPDTVINNENKKLKIFVSHGDLDDQISKEINVLSLKRINNFSGLDIHYYPSIGHYIDPYTLNDLGQYFYKNMK